MRIAGGDVDGDELMKLYRERRRTSRRVLRRPALPPLVAALAGADVVEERKAIELKGRGEVTTYGLVGRHAAQVV